MNEDLKTKCNYLREKQLEIEKDIRVILNTENDSRVELFTGQNQEICDQATCALRAAEDVRMRLGKVIQYSEDGRSCWDKEKQPEKRNA